MMTNKATNLGIADAAGLRRRRACYAAGRAAGRLLRALVPKLLALGAGVVFVAAILQLGGGAVPW